MPTAKKPEAEITKLVLPITIIGATDVNRVLRELEALEDFLAKPDTKDDQNKAALPLTSHNLENIVSQNDLSLKNPANRQQLQKHLLRIKEHAPRVNISFASDPSAGFMSKIVNWFRSEVNPEVLVQAGLAPNIAAGFILRTSNRVFDASLKQNLSGDHQILIDRIKSQPNTSEVKEAG